MAQNLKAEAQIWSTAQHAQDSGLVAYLVLGKLYRQLLLSITLDNLKVSSLL